MQDVTRRTGAISAEFVKQCAQMFCEVRHRDLVVTNVGLKVCSHTVFDDIFSHVLHACCTDMNVGRCQGIRLGPCTVPFSFTNINFDLVAILPIGQWQTSRRLFSVDVATHRATTPSFVVGDILFVTPDVMVGLPVAQFLLKNVLVIFFAAGCCPEIAGPEICWVQNHLRPGPQWPDPAQGKTVMRRTGERGGEIGANMNVVWHPVVNIMGAGRQGTHVLPGC